MARRPPLPPARKRGQRGLSRSRGSLGSTLGITSVTWAAVDIQNHSPAVIVAGTSALMLSVTQVPLNHAKFAACRGRRAAVAGRRLGPALSGGQIPGSRHSRPVSCDQGGRGDWSRSGGAGTLSA
jgi:hypothetical protein